MKHVFCEISTYRSKVLEIKSKTGAQSLYGEILFQVATAERIDCKKLDCKIDFILDSHTGYFLSKKILVST